MSAYFARQEEHHRVRTFQEEYLDYLNEYKVEYDERYTPGDESTANALRQRSGLSLAKPARLTGNCVPSDRTATLLSFA